MMIVHWVKTHPVVLNHRPFDFSFSLGKHSRGMLYEAQKSKLWRNVSPTFFVKEVFIILYAMKGFGGNLAEKQTKPFPHMTVFSCDL